MAWQARTRMQSAGAPCVVDMSRCWVHSWWHSASSKQCKSSSTVQEWLQRSTCDRCSLSLGHEGIVRDTHAQKCQMNGVSVCLLQPPIPQYTVQYATKTREKQKKIGRIAVIRAEETRNCSAAEPADYLQTVWCASAFVPFTVLQVDNRCSER